MVSLMKILMTVGICLSAGVVLAAEETIHFREGGGVGYTDVDFDDTKIDTPDTSDTYGNSTSLQVMHNGGHLVYSLMAVKDMFTELPKTTGGAEIDIKSATLHLTRYNAGTSSIVLEIYPITTNWLPDSAGNNENDVCYSYSEKSESTQWASGGWSSSDYDSAVCSTGNWVNNYNEACEIDITDVIAEMYDDEVNYGFLIDIDSEDSISYRSTENGTLSRCPSVEITYEYTQTTFSLTVNSGTGDGNYAQSATPTITADAAPSGQEFAQWVGDTSGIASQTSSPTTLTMPAANQEVTATYTDKTWTLTVNSGTGDGSYVVATMVDITADAAASGKQFDTWSGDVTGITDLEDSSTQIAMPYADAEITATYVSIYTLTVNNGSGDGTYEVGTIVDITADAAPTNTQTFDQWTGDTANLADAAAASTTMTMPASDAEITATYTNLKWTLTVNSGTGDGDYDAETIVDIAADTAPSGYAFDEWVGDTSDVLDVNDPTTKVTMPIHDVEVTAAYTAVHWDLTVNGGSGDGDYSVNTVVDITADAAASGEFFDKWTGDTSSIADVNDSSTTLTMPGSDAEVTATYTEVVNGLVTRYTFDTDARDTYGTSDGTLSNGASVVQDGERGAVLSLDGDNDYVDLPSANMAAGRSELTLAMWIKPDLWGSAYTIYDEYAEGAYWQFSITDATFYTRDSSTGTMGTRDNDIATPTVSTGQWHHIAVIYSDSGNKKAIYYDGSESASSSTSIDTLTSTRDGARIGYPCDGKYFNGMIDDVRLYSRALSDDEIAIVAGNPLYTLTVNNGSGDGDYVEDTVVNIAADAAPSGQDFDGWVGDTAGIANVSLSSTTITMPGDDAEITASYTDKTWTLVVNSGTGDGSYAAGTVVGIAADAAPSGQDFDEWVGDTAGITSVSSSSTNLTMPYADAEITATYTDKLWTLTVNSGSGDGSYAVDAVVQITADAPAEGKQFDQWVGDTAYVTSVISTSTNLTMPYGNAEVTATYDDIAAGTTETIHFREGGGTGYVDVDVDDTYIVYSPADNTTHGTESYQGLQAGGGKVFLIAIKDMFSELSASTNGSSIVIESATLHLMRYNTGTSSITLSVYPITTNWLPDAAGANENDVSGENAEVSEPTTWASGDFSSSDYDSAVVETGSWVNNYNEVADIDVSDVITEIYSDEVNYGMAVFANGSINGRASENASGKPRLEITYHYGAGAPTYALTVNSGSGDGSYAASTNVNISADAAASGYVFDEWTGDTANIASVSSASTTLTMPASSQEITATYEAVTLYTLTVNSGTGDGSYQQSWVVDIAAGAAPSGQQFDEWVGDTSGIANVGDNTTTLTMPAANAEVTATYTDVSGSYTLTVNSGSGDGTYQSGTVVNISADSAPSGMAFDEWTGDTATVADVEDSTTSITMPAANAEITATYGTLYTLTVNSGNGDGDYLAGTVVNISADSPASGKVFDDWVGDTSNVSNRYASDTTVNMPSDDVEVTATYDDMGSGPAISFTTGTWSQGSTVTVNGSSFGSHSDYGGSQDFLCRGWFDFETGGLSGGNFSCENSNVWDIKTTGTRNNSSYHGRKVYNGTRLGAMYVSTLANTHEFYSSFWINLSYTSGEDAGKIWRIWSDIHSDNIYLATGGGNTMIRGYSESTRVSPTTVWSSPNSLGYDQWHRMEVWMDDNPSEFTVWMDGNLQWTRDNWVPYPWYSGTHTWQFGHMINECVGGHNFDDLFADNTRARVEIGNASTWSGCSQREIQIPTGWSNSAVTIKANKGSFSSFSGKYLFVVDSNGNVSAGYAL